MFPVRWRETASIGSVVTLSSKTSSRRSFSAAHLILAGCTVLLSPGCAWHLGVPPKDEALPSTVTLESSPSKTTSASLSKLRFKALLLDGNGNLFLVWMGYRSAPSGGRLQSDILMRVCNNGKWGEEINVSQSAEDDWEIPLPVVS